jgi:hypothetical protein
VKNTQADCVANNDVQNETETGAMRDNSPATPLPAANEDGRI